MEGCTPAALLARLAELGIETKTVYHPAAPTVAEHSVHVSHLGGQAKQLFMRDKGGSFFLVSCLIDTEVDLKGMHSVALRRPCATHEC
jgi:Ala-tRNA(Pro) deacylase